MSDWPISNIEIVSICLIILFGGISAAHGIIVAIKRGRARPRRAPGLIINHAGKRYLEGNSVHESTTNAE